MFGVFNNKLYAMIMLHVNDNSFLLGRCKVDALIAEKTEEINKDVSLKHFTSTSAKRDESTTRVKGMLGKSNYLTLRRFSVLSYYFDISFNSKFTIYSCIFR